MRFGIFLLAVIPVHAQLILNGPIPKGANPPVVFLNGYQTTCGGDFASTFYTADQVMQAAGRVSLFFDNCSVPGRPSIEALGTAFGQFLGNLKYTDGSAVTQVDVVAHSMGGLIVRSYLAGKQDTAAASFNPPATTPIRKIVFLATPHFGSVVASLGGDKQASELVPGSSFLYQLNTWNQGIEDLRGIPSISLAGNGGTNPTAPGFDDGVVPLTSASLGFYQPAATRVVPYCHTSSVLLVLAQLCSGSTPVVANLSLDPGNPVSQLVTSFLAGTEAWKSVGQAIENNPLATATGGVYAELRDKDDKVQSIAGASVAATPKPIDLTVTGNAVAYADSLNTTNPIALTLTPPAGTAQTQTLALRATTSVSTVVKPGPRIFFGGVVPGARAQFPYDVAPGAFIAIYGENLASSSKAAPQPYPAQIDDVQVLVNDAPAAVQFISAGQINIVYPLNVSGLTKLTVKNAGGQHSLNVRVAPATPSVFELANRAAAATNAVGTVVSANAPLRAGDFLVVYLTGLGQTDVRNGLDYARIQPTVTVGGQDCPVSYAGRTPGVTALDQINCKVPAGVTGATVPVVVTSNGRQSVATTINVQ